MARHTFLFWASTLSLALAIPVSITVAQKPNTPPPGFLADKGNVNTNRPIPPDPFLTGITLSGDQQARVTAIHAKYRALMKERLESVYANARAKKLKTVTPNLDDLRQRHVAELKSVMMAGQQRTFAENVVRIDAMYARKKESIRSPKLH